MAKGRTRFVCRECGHALAKWAGKCPACGAWESFVEEAVRDDARRPAARAAGLEARPGPGPRPVTEVAAEANERLPTGLADLDRLLGGGLVAGATVLVGGEPGIGKSTLLLQAAHWLGLAGERAAPPRAPVLYVTAEESARQLRLRAARLQAMSPRLLVFAENDLDAIVDAAEAAAPGALVVDSIQTVAWAGLDSAAGSVAQVRECAAALAAFARRRHVPVFLVGHVTKEGALAGPKTLEHLVDVVLSFEGDGVHAARVLRAAKNRHGAVNEIAVFEMTGEGLRPVADPSRLFLAGRRPGAAGSVVGAPMAGARPTLVEVQALVAPAPPGNAKRRVAGVDPNRAAMVLAVLEKRCGLTLVDQDVFVNVVAGAEAREPGVDLAMAVAIAGSLRERAVDPDWVVVGEVGLGGEVRGVGQVEARLAEAERLGFRRALVPPGAARRGSRLARVPVETVDQALATLFG